MPRQPPYTLVGFLLGWGAPLGTLLLRYLWTEHPSIYLWIAREIQHHLLLYIYMTVSTTIAFALFGSWMGNRLVLFKRKITMLEQASEQLSELSMTDGLTGLYNHRYIQERLELEMQRSERYQAPLSILMVDIDDFKRLNDAYGHLFGDHVLKHLASLLLQSTRRIDIVGRYGGEEFLLLLPQTGEKTALEVAQRICRTVETTVLAPSIDPPVRMTVTIGVVSLPRGELKTKAAALQAADDALYEGKRHGKNRVEIHQGPSDHIPIQEAHHA